MLKKDRSTFNHGKIVNIYIVYELNKIYNNSHPTLVNCLFRAVSITKNAVIDKNKYTGYRVGFDRAGLYLLPCRKFFQNVIIFGVNMCSSIHIDSKGKDINGTEIIKFKTKDSDIVARPLCLGNISKDWSVDNMKDTGLNGYVYDFSVDYNATDVADIKDIHKYLIKKHNIV